MANIQSKGIKGPPRRHRGIKGPRKASRHRRRAGKRQRPRAKGNPRQGLPLKPLRSLMFDAVDEIGKVTEMLEAAPMFHSLALMVREIHEGMPANERDEMARAAKKHFGVDIDKLVEQPYEMGVIDEIPEALAASARWRLERLERVLYRGLRGKE